MDELETKVVETLGNNFEFLRRAAEESPFKIADLFYATINNFLASAIGYGSMDANLGEVGEKAQMLREQNDAMYGELKAKYDGKKDRVGPEQTFKDILNAYRESGFSTAISELRDTYSKVRESVDKDMRLDLDTFMKALSVLMDHGEGLFETTTRVGIDKDDKYEVLADSRSIAKLAGYSPEPLRASGKILIAEDDATVAELAKRLLERVGYEVVHVKTCEGDLNELWEGCEGNDQYAAVITCGALAGNGNGKDVAKRASDVYMVPVVGMTASFVSDPSVVTGLKEAGATYVIAKPFDNINSVVTAVESAIAQKMNLGR